MCILKLIWNYQNKISPDSFRQEQLTRPRLWRNAVALPMALAMIAGVAGTSESGASNAKVSEFSFNASLVEGNDVINITASDGKTYDSIEPGSLKVSARAIIKFRWRKGRVVKSGMYLGFCTSQVCENHPIIGYSGRSKEDYWPRKWNKIGKKTYQYDHVAEFNADQIPVSSSNGITPYNLGDVLIGKCNQLAESNRSGNITYFHNEDISISVDTKNKRRIGTDFIEADENNSIHDIADVNFHGGDQNKKSQVEFVVQCGPLIPTPKTVDGLGLEHDFGPMKVHDVKLTLTTYANQYTQPTPGTQCKKAKLVVTAETNQEGLVPIKLWNQINDWEITNEDLIVGAHFEDGKFIARHERWIEVDETTHMQYNARDLVNDPFYNESGWKDITLHCSGVGGGGLETELAPIEMSGALALFDEKGEQQFASCPRKIKAKPIVQANRHGQVDLRIHCGNGYSSLNKVQLSKLSATNTDDAGTPLNENMTHGTNQFLGYLLDVDKTQTLSCALSAKHSGGGTEQVLALEQIDVGCSKADPDLAGDIDGLESPDSDDDQEVPTGKTLVGGFGILDNSGDAKKNLCPRTAGSLIWFSSPKPDNIHYSLDCGELGNFPGVLQPEEQEDGSFKVANLLNFEVTKTIEAGCTLRTIAPYQPKDHMFKAHTFACAKSTGHSDGIGGLSGVEPNQDDGLPVPVPVPTPKVNPSVAGGVGGLTAGSKPTHGSQTLPTPVVTTTPEPVAIPSVCKGGKIRYGQCMCPKGTTRNKISRFEYVCKRDTFVSPDKPAKPDKPVRVNPPKRKKLTCIGGKVRGGKCKCGPNTQIREVNANKYQCIKVAKPPKKKKKAVRTNPPKKKKKAVRTNPPKKKKKAIRTNPSKKKKKAVRTNPPKKRVRKNPRQKKAGLVCQRGQVRGGKCYCSKKRKLKKLGKNKFACVKRR